MKKIGIIGGLSFASTAESYRLIASKANQYLCGYDTAEICMISVNPAVIFTAIQEEKWDIVAQELVSVAVDLEIMGVECIVIPCNTVHKVIDQLQRHIATPILNMMDCVGLHIKKNNFQTVGLLGTRFTMESGFYQDHLKQYYNINTTVPASKDREMIHQIIFNELVLGKFTSESRQYINAICDQLHCDAVVLGCTELPLLMSQVSPNMPLIDTIAVQAEYAVHYASGCH